MGIVCIVESDVFFYFCSIWAGKRIHQFCVSYVILNGDQYVAFMLSRSAIKRKKKYIYIYRAHKENGLFIGVS